jgi:hypothetical protein
MNILNHESLQPTFQDEADMDLFLDKIKNEYKDGWTEDNWEEVGLF